MAMDIIESNLTPVGPMRENIINCCIIVDSSNEDSSNIYDLHSKHKLAGQPMFTHHYLIMKNGKIFRGRQEEYEAFIDGKYNLNCIGIMIEGNFNKSEVNDIQFNSLMNLILEIRGRYTYIENSVYIHSELNDNFSYTPGTLFPYIDFKNRLLRNFLNIVSNVTNIHDEILYKLGTRNLEYKIPNMIGSDIFQFKILMIKLGYDIKHLDGIYDEELRNIIVQYYKDYKKNIESYYNGIVLVDWINEIEDIVMHLSFDRSDKYKRYLSVESPLLFGEDIYLIKEKLWTLGIYKGTIDNIYNKETSDAVMDYEKKFGISPSGTVGPLTFIEIMRCIDYRFNRVLELQEPLMEGADIEIIQKGLYKLGYNVDITGFYDLKTYNAVCTFQIDNNLILDGRVDEYIFNEILKGYS